MKYSNLLVALVAFFLCVCRGESEMETSLQLQEKFNGAVDLVSSVDKLLADLETRREELQKMRESLDLGEDKSYPTSCLQKNVKHNDTLMVKVPGHGPFPVLCDCELLGLGWTVIQRRRDGLVNFYRDWNDYKTGFGSLGGDFFIGLEKLNWLTKSHPFELYIHMENFQGVKKFAKYDEFLIGDESEGFSLKFLGSFTGTAGDSLTYHKGQKFSTFDRDNDNVKSQNCAQYYIGAWWYAACLNSNLNGQYLNYESPITTISTDVNRYIKWNSFESSKPLKFVQMMIRPKFGCF
ncbi:microfibril-associated glycoprotein 4 [Drosophila ananassae]|uniref:microfibril-associated glycoprotein 4 n=1 Tax=Drosophila ananassae TaxID=7217 RepID=UPI0013A5C499|nr:microfibril-associated glycoprotein 4 [Drosophila ananassae]